MRCGSERSTGSNGALAKSEVDESMKHATSDPSCNNTGQGEPINQLVGDFLEARISRRRFVQSLVALGISADGVRSIFQSAEAVAQGSEPPVQGATPVARRFTGTGGEVIVEQIRAAGVRYLFTNPGSFETGFFDAFLDQPEMQLILGLHEGIVIAMADGYHKVSQEPAFVNLHVVAGTAQAAGQLYNASRDGSALIVTAGLLDNEVYSDEVQLGARAGYNQKEINRQFTKMSWESHDARGLAAMLRRALKVAMTQPGGPVYLAVPSTILEQRNLTAEIYDRRHFLLPSDIPPSPQRVDEVAQMLLEAKSPALIFGDEVTKTNAQPEGLELAELLGVPVYETLRSAFHSFPRHHSLFAGQVLFSGKDIYIRDFLKGKDLVINIGENDLGDIDPRRAELVPAEPFYESGTKVVRIGVNTNALARNNPFGVAIVANAKLTLRALIDAVKSRATAERLARIRAARWSGRSDVEVRPANLGQSPLHPDELGWALQQELDRDAIIVSENLTGANHFLSTGFRENEKKWVSNSGSGLGWSVGAATGAALAAPDRQVVCNIGDGSVMYSAAGFWTQARYAVPVLTVVCNNRNYQSVRRAFAQYEGKMKNANRYPGMYLGDPDIDFVKLANAQGIEGARVEHSAELRKALRRGIAATRRGSPFLVEVVVQRTGPGADSTWHQAFSLAKTRNSKA
jgi:thiamine pyrophosphate-dependent acetolactate synthase large subunit-like protein